MCLLLCAEVCLHVCKCEHVHACVRVCVCEKEKSMYVLVGLMCLCLYLSHVHICVCVCVYVLQDSHSALHLAVRRCQVEVVRCLLAHRCPADHQDRHGNTPIHIACKDGNLPVTMAICAAKANLDIPNKVSHHFPSGYHGNGMASQQQDLRAGRC